LGTGIATAFVATLYGVGFANLILLPIAGNLKQKTREKILLKEVILQGILSIQMQENPAIIEEKLIAYLKFHHKNTFATV
jgi:chemotaxis protein MotA